MNHLTLEQLLRQGRELLTADRVAEQARAAEQEQYRQERWQALLGCARQWLGELADCLPLSPPPDFTGEHRYRLTLRPWHEAGIRVWVDPQENGDWALCGDEWLVEVAFDWDREYCDDEPIGTRVAPVSGLARAVARCHEAGAAYRDAARRHLAQLACPESAAPAPAGEPSAAPGSPPPEAP